MIPTITLALALLLPPVAKPDDLAVRLPGASVPIQTEYVGTYLRNLGNDDLIVWEDGSITIEER